MELIKKKILLKDIKKGDVKFKIMLTQKIDGLGMLSDIPGLSIITRESNSEKLHFNFDYSTETLKKSYKDAGQIISITDSKLQKLRTYDADVPYKEDFNMKKETYLDYLGNQINGVDRVVKIDEDEVTYVMGAKADINIGTTGQTTGFLFIDNPKDGLIFNNAERTNDMTTSVQYMGEGWNSRNTSADPQIREEYLLGIIEEPEVESDVFIDRGALSVFDKHLRLSEIENLDHLVRYGNGFYNINRD